MMIETSLAGDKLFLATLNESGNHERYLSWLSDPEVLRYLEIRHAPPATPESICEYVMNMNSSQDNLLLGIFTCENQTHVGNIKLGPINRRHLHAEVGFLIGDKSIWGRGYASEAIALLAKYAFEKLHLAKLTAGCYAGNVGSEKALIRAGFVLEARLSSHLVFEGQRVDKWVFGRLARGGEK